MRTTFFITSCVAAVMAAITASARTSAPAPAPSVRTDVAPKVQAGQWRASKLRGLSIDNEENKKLGDIKPEVLRGGRLRLSWPPQLPWKACLLCTRR
jgi:hypothetical protein